MARDKVVLPPNSSGQAMGISTYSNGADTVGAPETMLVDTSGTPITPTTPSDTQPVSVASLPLPSGAATAAKQPALGTAGSASADVLSIQGITSMTPVKVDGSGVTQPVSIADGSDSATGAKADSAASSDTGTFSLIALVKRLLQKLTTQLPAALGSNGGLKIEGVASGQAVPVSGTFYQATQPVSIAATVAVDSELPAAAALNGTIAKSVSAPVVGAALLVSDNTNLIQPLGDATNGLDVDVTRLPSGTVAGSSSLPAGTNNIGDVDVLTLPALVAGTANIGDVDVLTQPARARTTDHIGAAHMTDAIMTGTTALTPKFAAIAAASSGNNTLVALVSSKKIRVLALMLVASAATNIYFADGAATVIFGGSTNKINLAANGGFVLPFNPVGWMETAASQALVLNLSAANACGGGLVYVEV